MGIKRLPNSRGEGLGVRGKIQVTKPMSPVEFSRLRRQMSDEYEGLMWQLLRNRQRSNEKFRREHPIVLVSCETRTKESTLPTFTVSQRSWLLKLTAEVTCLPKQNIMMRLEING